MKELLNLIAPILDLLQKIPGFPSISPLGGQTGTEVMQLPSDTLTAIQANHLYNRYIYRKLMRLTIIQAALILVMIVVAASIIILANPQDRFFVASSNGTITRILPLDTPLMNDTDVYVRVGTAVADAATFGFLDFQQRRNEVSSAFQGKPLDELYAQILGSGGTSAMNNNQRVYIAKVEPSRPGGVVKKTIVTNIFQWVIQVPLIITIQTATGAQPDMIQRWTVQVLTERSKSVESPGGIVITRLLGAAPDGPAQPAPATSRGAP
jgi:hypothetical protein